MAEINLLRSLPQTRRNICARSAAKTPTGIAIASQFGQTYFDGPREFGYGGYVYDGRWVSVARDIVRHFNLGPGSRILDVGCAKGFLVKDLMGVCPGLEAFGVDISEYALMHCEKEAVGRLHLGNAINLPFPDGSFDAVVSINTIHNLELPDVVVALKEIQRISSGRAFVQVDAYFTEEQRELFMKWVLTAKYHDYPDAWIRLFDHAGYTGDWFWTVVEA